MKLKNLFAAFAAGVMLFSLAGCSGGNSSDGSSASDASTPASDSSTPSSEGGILKVGVKDAVIGFGYKDPLTGEYEGMEIELAKKLADSLG